MRLCLVCKKSFSPTVYNKMCCSQKCSWLARHRKRNNLQIENFLKIIPCPVCDSLINIANKNSYQIFCSKDCYYRAKKRRNKNLPINDKDQKLPDPKHCLVCDKQYTPTGKNQIYCSSKCNRNASSRRKRNFPIKLKDLACIVCNKVFHQKRYNNTEYCSSSCKKLGISRRYNGREVKGKKKHIWGSGYITNHGYRMISKKHPNSSKRGQILEHVYIMSEHLGRPLEKHETVHHKNGIRDDNRLENLELWSKSQPSGKRITDMLVWCKKFIEQYEKDDIFREIHHKEKL